MATGPGSKPALALLLCAVSLAAQTRPPVTLLIQFEDDYSHSVLEAMKKEIDRIGTTAQLSFRYKLRSEFNESDTPADIVLVKFRGRCRMQTVPALLDERGPLAITHTVDGQVLPFSEIACDRIRVSVRSAMWGAHWRDPDGVLGRALGRIVAHELYHMLANAVSHASEGIAKAALSAEQLVAADMVLDEVSVKKMKQ